MILIYSVVAILVLGIVVYVRLFYPMQLIDPNSIQSVWVTTPEEAKYHNDVLHPCIRRMSDGGYVMVQSPWYKCQDGMENPILYISDDPMKWDKGIVVEDTPAKGYYSDPNVYEENGRIYVFWREVGTPLCEMLKVICAVVGVWTDDKGKTFSKKQVYITRTDEKIGTEICPILIKKEGKFRFYTTWYQTWRQDRHNLGIAIWEGTSLEKPDFTMIKQVPFKTKYVCDKIKQKKIFCHLFFIPRPHKFDLWHFDLFEKEGKLYMIASEEMKDVVVLAESEDWENFKLLRKPLINAHYMENYVGYRQTYYKPTAYYKGDDGETQIFYTANPPQEYFVHRLYKTTINLR